MSVNVDQGERFGTWPDPTSQYLYQDLTSAILSGADTSGIVVDLGGGNGLLRATIPHLTTVDTDPAKQPDTLADITTWKPLDPVNLAICRYVTHYLDDQELTQTLTTVAEYSENLIVASITTPAVVKDAHSVNEPRRYWRTRPELERAFDLYWVINVRRGFTFNVTAEFYRNRLNHPDPTGHEETVTVWHLTRRIRVLDQ